MSVRLVQAALLLAGAAAVIILLGRFDTAVDIVALGAIVVALIATAPAGRAAGGGWWSLLAAGTLLSVLGALLALVTEPVGGLVALLGGIAVLTAVAFGFPARRI
ncbi:MAG TPA: hypothetical protein VFH44_03165 [Solirubrobacterales bacterium]|nr:hypothetical protein [Solirubrobacterales bacterium]